MSYSRIRLALSLLPLLALPATAEPLPLPAPTGEVILTVTGEISRTNDGDAARFDLAMLETLGTVSMATTTPWTHGIQTFDAVSLKAVLDRVGATGNVIFAEAYNDYSSVIPISDATDDGAMIAFRMNGKEMTLREKGPLWVVYRYDEDPEYSSDLYLTRSIWQLDSITVKQSQTGSEN